MISFTKNLKYLPYIIFFILSILYWKIDVLDSGTDQSNWWVQGDLYAYFYQMSHYAFSRLANGEIPLWNPYQSGGIPFLATYMVGVFYPLNFLYLFCPTHLAMGYTTILHIFLGGVFMYLYGRSIKLSTRAAIIAAVSFMFSGWVLETMWRTPEINTCVWIPLVFFCLEMLLQKRKYTWIIALSVTLAMQILAGLMQMVVHTLYIAGFYSLFRLILIYKEERSIKSVIYVSCYIIIGILTVFFLTAFQLFPTMELSSLSMRSAGSLSLQQADPCGSYFSPGVILKAIFNATQHAHHPRWEYMGIIPILLSCLSLFHSQQKRISYFFFGSGVLFLFLSFGTNTPLYKLYHSLPTGDWFRNPTRFLYLFTFSSSVLSGLGWDKLSVTLENKPLKGAITISIMSLVMLFCIWLLKNELIPACIYLILFAGIVWLTLFFCHSIYLKLLTGAIIIIIIFDLFYVNKFIYRHPQIASGFFHKYEDVTNTIKELQGNYRSYVWFEPFATDFSLTSKIGTSDRIYVINDHEPFSLCRYAEYVECMTLGRMDNPRENQYPFVGIYPIGMETKHLKLFDLLSVKYIVANQGVGNLPAGYKPIYQGSAGIFENPHPIPRAYLVNKIKVIEGKAVLEELSKEEFNPFEYVVLEESIPGYSSNNGWNSSWDMETNTVSLMKDLPEKVVVHVNNQNDGVLVLADTYYPGWKAFVDGREEKIYRANYLFRGVPLKAGNHIVKFIYKPESFKRGLCITISTLVFLVSVAIITIIRRRNK